MAVFNLQRWLIAWLRRGSYRVPGVYSEVKNRARISRGLYKCAKCKGEFKNGDYQIDHIRPVIDTNTGFTNFDDYIKRLYCGPDGLQLLCKPCHAKKTAKENKKRRVTLKVLCPAHKDTNPSLHLYEEWAHCYTCGYHVRIEEIATPEQILSMQKEPTDIGAELEYISSLPLKEIRGLALPADDRGYYIVWPDGHFYKKRMFNDTPRYVAPRGHPLPLFVYSVHPRNLVIVEGELNAMSLHEACVTDATIASPGGVAVPRKNRQLKYLDKFLTFDQIIVIVDKDVAGVCWGVKVKEELLKRGKRVQLIALEKDFNQQLQDGGIEEIRKTWKSQVDLF